MMNMDVLELPGVDQEPVRIYLEKDIFFNSRLGQLKSGTSLVGLNFRESILLKLLLDGRVRKQKVIDAAWGDNGVVVTEASYHQLVRSLRKKFAEIGLPAQSIKTLPRFGLEYLREHPLSAETFMEEGKARLLERPGLPAGPDPDRSRKWSRKALLLLLPFLFGFLLGNVSGPATTFIALHASS